MGEIYRRTNITATLHRSGLYGSVDRLNPLFNVDTWKHNWNLQKSTSDKHLDNSIKFFWRNLKMCICPHPTWQSLRGEEVRRRMADNWQMLMSKACRIKLKNTWGCKGTSAKYLVNTYAIYLFEFFIFNTFTKLWQFCLCFVNMVYGV